jgi:ABC-2 type transport system ATP-binding protein
MEEANRLCHRVSIIRSGRIVAIDAPEKLKAAIDRLHRIEVSFDREVPPDALATLPGVTGMHRTGDKWQITAENRDTAIRPLVAVMKSFGTAVTIDDSSFFFVKEREVSGVIVQQGRDFPNQPVFINKRCR